MDRKPGRPRALTVDVIAAAALEDGIATFSMPSVARRLGVAHSGLYRYVTDRDDLKKEGEAQQDKAEAQRDVAKKEAEAEAARSAEKAAEARQKAAE